MSYRYVDGRGGSREGAGRPKSDNPKKAFRITDQERQLIKSFRLLTEDGYQLLEESVSKIVECHTRTYWY